MQNFDTIPETALNWHEAGQGAALATVIETWGSAPRRVGSQLAVSGAGDMAGSVSGGCVEGAVVVEAMEAIADGSARELEFGVSDGDAFAVGLACGGTIRVLVEPVGSAMPVPVLQRLVAARADRRAVAYIADLDSGARLLAQQGSAEASDLTARFRMDRSGFEDGTRRFIAIHNPPLRLLIVGAVHIAQALVPMARIAGYDPVIIDPREAFASDTRFPGETLCHAWPDEAVAEHGLDQRTALVLLTHDPKLDDPALQIALTSECFYIGALGSTRTHAKRCDRLRGIGFDQTSLDRIKGPIGLDIGASGPAEIAVSIIAEMTQTLRKGG